MHAHKRYPYGTHMPSSPIFTIPPHQLRLHVEIKPRKKNKISRNQIKIYQNLPLLSFFFFFLQKHKIKITGKSSKSVRSGQQLTAGIQKRHNIHVKGNIICRIRSPNPTQLQVGLHPSFNPLTTLNDHYITSIVYISNV